MIDIINKVNKKGITAIMAAGNRGHARIISALLRSGATVPYSDFGWTAARISWVRLRASLGVGVRPADS